MNKEDQIITMLQALERESKLIRGLLTALLAIVSLFIMVSLMSGLGS